MSRATKTERCPPPARSRGHRVRAYGLLLLFIFLRPFGNLSMAWGTKHFPQSLSIHPLVYLQAMLDPFVALGIALLILSLLTRMALLSLADLSFVLPVTAVGYVLAAVFDRERRHLGLAQRTAQDQHWALRAAGCPGGRFRRQRAVVSRRDRRRGMGDMIGDGTLSEARDLIRRESAACG